MGTACVKLHTELKGQLSLMDAGELRGGDSEGGKGGSLFIHIIYTRVLHA